MEQYIGNSRNSVVPDTAGIPNTSQTLIEGNNKSNILFHYLISFTVIHFL